MKNKKLPPNGILVALSSVFCPEHAPIGEHAFDLFVGHGFENSNFPPRQELAEEEEDGGGGGGVYR